MLPLSVLSFRTLCHSLALDQDIASGTLSQLSADNGVFGSSLEKYFRVCVKAKKRHEVDVLAEVGMVISSLNLGSYQGHM